MKNKEIEELLDELKDENNYIEEYGFRYKRIALDDWWLLLSYIEQLENNRDKAIEYIKMHSNALGVLDTIENYTLLDILKGDSDD